MTEVHDLAAPYALDSLEADERAAFESHLETCRDCRRELDTLRETAAMLATEAIPPPEGLRERVLTAAGQLTQEREEPMPDAKPGQRWGWLPRVAFPALAAAVAAIIVMTAALIQQGNRLDEARDVERLLAVPDATVAALDAHDAGSLRFVHSASEDRGILLGSDVPAVDVDITYQFWVIDNAGARPAGVFRPTDGEFRLAVANVGEAVALGVTREPRGGSPQPTGDLVYEVDLTTQ